MHLLWILLGLIPAVLIFFTWRSTRSVENKFFDSASPDSQPPVNVESRPVLAPLNVPVREMRWISVTDFRKILSLGGDLIVIDLRTDALKAGFPVSDAFVLPVAPHDILSVLQSLPADQSVVLYGASNLCIFLIETSSCIQGSAPFFLLEGDVRSLEVA